MPPITGTIIVTGKTATTTIFDGQFINARAFTVLEAGKLLIQNLTMQSFDRLCDGCENDGGGALENAGGELRVEDCIVAGNGTFNEFGSETFGGGIFNQSGRLEIDHTTVQGNRDIVFGGGVAVTGGSAVIEDSLILDNTAVRSCGCNFGVSFGGGLYVNNAKVWVVRSTISGNATDDDEGSLFEAAGSGGGIYNDGAGEMRVTDSAIVQNITFHPGVGGGIANVGRMVVLNSTIAGNTSGSGGGGLFNFGDLTVQGLTVTNNTLTGILAPCGPLDPRGAGPCNVGGSGIGTGIENSTTRIAGSVIAANPGTNCFGTQISNGHNAIGSDSSCILVAASGAQHDLPSVDPRFGLFTDNGRPGNGHYPLLADSPLIDAGGNPGRFCTRHDQLGDPRVNAEHPRHGEPLCDIGAIEFRP
jgi:hypothetical protein